jgi:hypothetical protein
VADGSKQNLFKDGETVRKMSPKNTVLAIYPEAYVRRGDHFTGSQYFAVFIRRTPKGTSSGYAVLLGSSGSPKGAWFDAMKQITKEMMNKLES